MAMTSYEVVRRAIKFQGPDRLPLRFSTLGLDDTHGVGTNAIGTGDHSKRETYDEWGCVWMRSEVANMGQVRGHPLEDWSTIESYPWPDPDAPGTTRAWPSASPALRASTCTPGSLCSSLSVCTPCAA